MTWNKIYSLLDNQDRNGCIIFFFLVILLVLVETLLVAITYPLLTYFVDQEILIKNEYLQNLLNYFNIQNVDFFLLASLGTYVLFRFVYNVFFVWTTQNFLNRIQKKTSEKLFSVYFRTNFLKSKKIHSSELIRDITFESASFKKALESYIVLFSEILLILFIGIYLIFLSPKLTITIFTFFILLFFLYFLIIKNYLLNLAKIRLTSKRKVIKNITDSLNFFELIRIYKREDFFLNNLLFNFKKSLHIQKMIAVVGILPKVIIETILIIAIILSIFYFLQINNTNYSEYISIAGTLLAAAYKISPSITKIMNSFQSIKILSNTIDHLKKKIKGSFSKTKKRKDNIYNFKNKLVFNNINLDLGNNKLFANLNLKIKKGSFNAIVGDSGKGKTSIFNLIMGLIEPTKGKILIDNNTLSIFLNGK